MPTDNPIVVTRRRVLVIDDHADACESLTVLLSLYGHEARGVTSGYAAFELAPTFGPDVCMVDIRMPFMDGFAVAARLRDLLGPAVRLVAVTGELTTGHDPRRVVFERILTKPVDPNELLRTVRENPSL